MTSIPVFVQARMNSSRLPGKVLRDLHQKPLLAWLFGALNHCQLAYNIHLITSDQTTDDPLAKYASANSISCFRGPLDDVASRFMLATQHFHCQAFVRICGDSPLLDYRLVDHAIDMFQKSSAELVTNVLPRSFPKGQSVEVVSTKAFANARKRMLNAEHREHVTSIFYEQVEQFHIESFTSGGQWQNLQMSVDSQTDFVLAQSLLAGLDRPHWQYTWTDLAERVQQLTGETPC